MTVSDIFGPCIIKHSLRGDKAGSGLCMRVAAGTLLALIALLFAAGSVWEIINPIFGIAHRGPIHAVKYTFAVILGAFLAWISFWWSRKLFEDARDTS